MNTRKDTISNPLFADKNSISEPVSSPIVPVFGLAAQQAERRTVSPEVVGSSPIQVVFSCKKAP